MSQDSSEHATESTPGPTDVAFIGLGVMGYPMAGHLAAAGHRVTVFNRTSSVARRWSDEHTGTIAMTPSNAADGAEIVFMCVGADNDVRAVVYGDDGALAAMSEGSILVDHTTASADLAQELSDEGAARGVGFVDAPVSGGEAGARNGARLPVTALVDQFYKRIGELGGGRWDTSSLIALLRPPRDGI